MNNFEIETIMREIIQEITKPIVLKYSLQYEELNNYCKISRIQIKLLMSIQEKLICFTIHQIPFNVNGSYYSILSKLLSELISKLQSDCKLREEQQAEYENRSNSEQTQMKYDIGVSKFEQETLKKEISVLGEVVQSLTERVEIYNNHASQKIYQLEFQVNSVDTQNIKEMKELFSQIQHNAEKTHNLSLSTCSLSSKVSSMGQEIATIQSSKTWMQDLIIELREKCQFYTTINYVDDKLNEFRKNNISFEQTQQIQNFPQELNQIDQEDIKSIIERSISIFEFKLETKLEGIEQNLQLNQQKTSEEMASKYHNTHQNLLEIKQRFNELQQLQIIENSSKEREKISAKQKAQQIEEQIDSLRNLMNKMQAKITTITTNITGLDLRMAETSQRVSSMEEKQNTIESQPQYFTNSIKLIEEQNPPKESELKISQDQSIQVEFEQPQQFEFSTNPYREQVDLKEKIQNQIIKLKSDLYNQQQYQTSQINQLFKITSTKDLEVQDLQKQLRQHQYYFFVLFSIVLHNELVQSDYQVKLMFNGLKFEFLPFQQDERTHLTFQNVKTAKIDLIMKTIDWTNSSIKHQRQNAFEYQQEKKRYDSETSRKEQTVVSDSQRKPEIQTIYTQKRQSKFLDDKLKTQTDHLNISLDSHQYCLLPKQRVKKVLVKYKKNIE